MNINGQVVTEIGTMVDPVADVVTVGGEKVRPMTEKVYVAVNKPRGVLITASDPHGRTTVYETVEDLPKGIFAIGRLDMDSEGLLLLTNDGKLGHRLSHPRFAVERVYEVGVNAGVSVEVIARLTQGIQAEDGLLKAKEARVLRLDGQGCVLEITLTTGKKREIRRMLAACGLEVLELTRKSFGGVSLSDLAEGDWRHLTRDEVRGLRRMVEQAYLRRLNGTENAEVGQGPDSGEDIDENRRVEGS